MTARKAGVYLRPAGWLGGIAGRLAVEQGKAGLIAGAWSAFSLVEVVRRDGERVKRNWLSYPEVAASSEMALSGLLTQITATRVPIAGLPMTEPQIMGIVNVTPDSFSDGGQFLASDAAIAHGQQLQRDDASMLDIGGESTRPGAEPVSDDQEIERVVPVLKGLKGLANVNAILSIDTRKPSVMKHAAAAGAGFINDVTALTFSPDSLTTAAKTGLPICLMHSQGTPQTMQNNPQYDEVVLDVYDYLSDRIAACLQAGIDKNRIIIDPGIGFGKAVRHNLALIDEVAMFHGLGVPILLGASRKSFIGAVVGDKDANKRLPGSLAAALNGLQSGVQILRVHDVGETVQAVQIWQASENSPQF